MKSKNKNTNNERIDLCRAARIRAEKAHQQLMNAIIIVGAAIILVLIIKGCIK